MSYTGKVQNGVVVLPPEAHLAEGTEVRVEPVKKQGRKPHPEPSLGKMLLEFAGKAKGLPAEGG